MSILVQVGPVGTRGSYIMADMPTAEQAEHALFIVRWYKEFLLGAGALLGIFATIKKGQQVPVTLTMSPDEVENRLMLCRHELKSEIHKEFHEALREHQKDMLKNIELMIKASGK